MQHCQSLLFYTFLFLFSFLSGCLAVVQGTVNQQLGLILGFGTIATFISFGTGLLILTGMVLTEARLYSLPVLLTWKARPHPSLFLAGPLGVLFVTTSIFITLYTGFALYYLFLVFGQLIAAVVADAHGFGVKDGTPIPPTLPRLLLLALALVGVLLSVLEALLGSASAAFPASSLGWCAIAALAGAGALVQSVLNRRASLLLPSKLQATWWSFCIGTLLALLLFGIQAAALGSSSAVAATLHAKASSLQGQHFIGGALGVVFIFCAIYVPELIGSQAFSVALVSGQLVCSAVMDALGALGLAVRVLSPLRVAGVVLVLCAAAGTQLVQGRRGLLCSAAGGGGSSGVGGSGNAPLPPPAEQGLGVEGAGVALRVPQAPASGAGVRIA